MHDVDQHVGAVNLTAGKWLGERQLTPGPDVESIWE